MSEKSINSLVVTAVDALDILLSRHQLLELSSASGADDMRLLLNVYLKVTEAPLAKLSSTLTTIQQITRGENEVQI